MIAVFYRTFARDYFIFITRGCASCFLCYYSYTSILTCILIFILEFFMATDKQAPVVDSMELSTSERWLATRGLEALRASVARAMKIEHDPEVVKARQHELNAIDALILRFR